MAGKNSVADELEKIHDQGLHCRLFEIPSGFMSVDSCKCDCKDVKNASLQ